MPIEQDMFSRIALDFIKNDDFRNDSLSKRNLQKKEEKIKEQKLTPSFSETDNNSRKVDISGWTNDLKTTADWTKEMFEMENNPVVMDEIMRSTELKNMMNDPEMIREMMTNDPEFRSILEQDPELTNLINNPEVLKQAMYEADNVKEPCESTAASEKKTLEKKGDMDQKSVQKETSRILIPDHLSKDKLRDKIKGCIFGAFIGSSLGLAQATQSLSISENKQNKNKNNIEFWSPSMNQLILLLDSILISNGTLDVSIFSEQLQCSQAATDDTNFGKGDRNGHRKVPDNAIIIDANTAVARSLIIGLTSFWDIDNVVSNARLQAKVTHSEPRCSAASIAVAVAVATMLTEPDIYIPVVVREAFKIAKTELGDNSEDIFRLHQHMFASSLFDLKLSEYGHDLDAEKAVGAGFTSLRINNTEVGSLSSDMMVKVKEEESKLWNDHDAVQHSNSTNQGSKMSPQPFVIDLQKMSSNDDQFQLQLQQQIETYQSRITQSLNFSKIHSSLVDDNAKSSPNSLNKNVSTCDFLEILHEVIECGGAVDGNATTTGALLGIHFGFEVIQKKWPHTGTQCKQLITQCTRLFKWLGIDHHSEDK